MVYQIESTLLSAIYCVHIDCFEFCNASQKYKVLCTLEFWDDIIDFLVATPCVFAYHYFEAFRAVNFIQRVAPNLNFKSLLFFMQPVY